MDGTTSKALVDFLNELVAVVGLVGGCWLLWHLMGANNQRKAQQRGYEIERTIRRLEWEEAEEQRAREAAESVMETLRNDVHTGEPVHDDAGWQDARI